MTDAELIGRAYELAGAHNPHPNPRVGAVVVDATGQIIAEGSHRGPGLPHAEVAALDEVADRKPDTIYVSLEPCSHEGRTPPCADRLIDEGLRRVVVGVVDPDVRVAGRGIERLREAGVEVEVLDDPLAREVDPGYFHHRQTGRPLVTLKYAMTLDGSVAASDGSSRWISSEEAREDAHRLRSLSDAVVVGAGTLRVDDPSLDVRLEGFAGRQPVPVVIAGRSPLPQDRKIWRRDPVVFSTRTLAVPAGRCVVVDGEDHPDPAAVLAWLAEEGLLTVMLEGGPALAGSWLRSGVITRAVVYLAGKVGGGSGMQPLSGDFVSIEDARTATIVSSRAVGPDLRIDYEMDL